jgi:glycosyltransferase involved in cell wall biosynthesis
MEKKTRVLAVTSGVKTPSSRFRIRQHIERLRTLNIIVDDECPMIDKNKSVPYLSKISPKYYLPLYAVWQLIKVLQRIPIFIRQAKYDYIWLNRELLTGYYTLEPLFIKNVILDVDDAIWKNPPFGEFAARQLAIKSKKIICGNEYLGSWFKKYNSKVYIIPTAVDTDKFKPVLRSREYISLGWIGTHGNLKYLENIYPVLLDILAIYPHVQLNIVSDIKPSFINADSAVKYIKWTSEDEVRNFQEIDIGLMPLDDDEWTRGKCSYKMLQHMACGSLVLGSPVGMNNTVLLGEANGAYSVSNIDDWRRVLIDTISNFEQKYHQQSELARKFIVDEFSSEIISKKLAKVFADE